MIIFAHSGCNTYCTILQLLWGLAIQVHSKLHFLVSPLNQHWFNSFILSTFLQLSLVLARSSPLSSKVLRLRYLFSFFPFSCMQCLNCIYSRTFLNFQEYAVGLFWCIWCQQNQWIFCCLFLFWKLKLTAVRVCYRLKNADSCSALADYAQS